MQTLKISLTSFVHKISPTPTTTITARRQNHPHLP